MKKQSRPWFLKIYLPVGAGTEQRELLSTIMMRLARSFSFLGMEDWRASVPEREKVLGIESEFHNIIRFQEKNSPMVLYFQIKKDAAIFSSLLQKSFQDLKISEAKQQAPKDWMKEWRKHYKEIKITEGKHKIWILPAWKKNTKRSSEIVVRIYPGQAFGTGTHSTTALCLELFLRVTEKLLTHKKISLLDFGAGTAVLAIAAAKWTQKNKIPLEALGVEIDPIALEQGEKNIRINRAPIKMKKKLALAKQYDLVFANVLAPVLLQEKNLLQASVKKEGYLILSGLLAKEGKSFLAEFLKGSTNFTLVELREKKEWCAILLQRK